MSKQDDASLTEKLSEKDIAAKTKANEFLVATVKDMEKTSGRQLDNDELSKVIELTSNLKNIGNQDGPTKFSQALEEFGKMAPDHVSRTTARIDEYHKNEPEKQELVSSVLKNVTLKKEPEPEVALDSFGSGTPSIKNSLGAPGIDEITQAIREEVLTKQQAYLQEEIAKKMSPENGALFKQQTPEEVRAFLEKPEGKDLVKLIMSNREAQLAMNKIEVDGYKKVHEAHKDGFKNVGWNQETDTKVRIAEIKNDAGEKVASLKETTVDATPIQVTLEDGTTKSIKSYREIDFPLKLEDGKGPAHFSMAVKDENGKNISAKDAVYFTAHYDDAGKLTEVSSPVPVKFMGKGNEAIGYIERDGKVYTLPVTQGKYKEMMKEVAINKGLGVDLAQSVDSVNVESPTLETQKQAPDLQKVGSIVPPEKPKQDPELGSEKVKLEKDSVIETPNVIKESITLGESKVEKDTSIETGMINQITGNRVTPETIQKASEIRRALDTSSPRTPEIDNGKALEMLSGKSSKQALEALTTAIGNGDEQLVKAMINVIDKPPKDAKIPEIGTVALKKAYIEQMDSAKDMKPDQRAKVQRASGAIASSSGIADHAQRVGNSKPTGQVIG